MVNRTTEYARKPLEEMNLIDNFLFTEVMADKEDGERTCRIILETVLKRKLGKISFDYQKVVPGISESSHGIIMDAFIREDVSDNAGTSSEIKVYDIEPDKRESKRSDLPRRSRYYGDLVDVQLLETGIDYEKLPEFVTIFILSYDPFGENDMYYEAGTVLKTHPGIPYNDGVYRIFLYVNGKLPENADEDDIKLKNLLLYMNKSVPEYATDEATAELDDIVRRTKSKKEVGIRYMKSWEWEREIKEESEKYGETKGDLKRLISLICKKLAKGKSISAIADELEEDDERFVEQISEIVSKYAPEYDIEAIYDEYNKSLGNVSVS